MSRLTKSERGDEKVRAFSEIMKTDILAMVLAGGKGSRLGKLTKKIAKPAVPFGGKYRMIDFALSNCANSGINDVGVITQYQPQILNDHIGGGESWGFNRFSGRASTLQPYSSTEGKKWFEGTAHAIYQNIEFIDRHDPEHVLILSGDHIYKMDYDKLFRFHKEKDADLTVGVIPVEWEEASRFGIMNTDSTNRIIEFEEKPENPKNNMASMGIYIFKWEKLRKYLEDNQTKEREMTDFGKHVIPAYLSNSEKTFAYAFNGYWKDVGTIKSLWKANLEMIHPGHELRKKNDGWRVYSEIPNTVPQYITENGSVNNSLVTDGAYVGGEIDHSVLSYNVRVGTGSVIKNSFIMPNVAIGENVQIKNAIVGEGAKIYDDASLVGTEDEIAVLGYYEEMGGLKDEE